MGRIFSPLCSFRFFVSLQFARSPNRILSLSLCDSFARLLDRPVVRCVPFASLVRWLRHFIRRIARRARRERTLKFAFAATFVVVLFHRRRRSSRPTRIV